MTSDLPVNGTTAVFGIVGHPVSHTLSPLLHNAAFRFRKFNGIYVPFDVPGRPTNSLKKGIIELGLRGLSVTIPHKAWAARVADESDALTRLCGAANTLIVKKGRILASNTDGPGAVRALKEKAGPLAGARILVVGYGGSATGIVHALLLSEKPEEIVVTGRNKTKRRKFVAAVVRAHGGRHGVRESDLGSVQPESIDIIVNATPLGMKGGSEELPIPESFISEKHIVFDIVYNPSRTPLLSAAVRRGARTIQGYLMLLYQAALQFELFTGLRAPESVMEKELLRALGRL